MDDLAYSFRLIRRSPGFATVAIVTLAIGIGANTAIVSVLDAVLRRELAVQAPTDLVFVRTAGSRGLGNAPPYPYFDRLREESESFTGMAAFAADELRLEVGGAAEQVFGQVASGNYFQVLGVEPVVGRLMRAGDERLVPPVAVIGYGYWQRRFSGSAHAIGQTLSFRDRTFTIIGVTPRHFYGLEPGRQVDVTLPITLEPEMIANRNVQWFHAVARLRAGIDPRQATARINAQLAPLRTELARPGQDARAAFGRLELMPASRGLDQLRTRFRDPLSALTLVTVILLSITCANIGGLLLVRGAVRSRELALRLAAGATSQRLLRQLLTETLVVFVLGAIASLFVSYASVEALIGLLATGRRPILLDIQFDWQTIAYSLGVTLLASVATGLWPALRALRIQPLMAIKDKDGRRSAGTGRRVFVAAQVALSLTLLVAAALFAQTMMNIRGAELGFKPDSVVTMSLDSALPRDAGPDAREQLRARWLERVRALPNVRNASLSVLTPLSGRNTGVAISVPGTTVRTQIPVNHVSVGYFTTFGIDVLAGRSFIEQDRAGSSKVVMLSASAARLLFAGRSPLGERIEFERAGIYQVIGVVRDHKHLSVREHAPAVAFVPLSQPVGPLGRLTLAVSSTAPGTTVANAAASEIRTVHRGTLISDPMTVNGQIDETLVGERLLSSLSTGFTVLVVALTIIGLYGTVGYSVATRTTEFGVRLALGAPRASVALDVLASAMSPVAIGIAVGLPIAATVARAAERLLFEVSAADATSYEFGAATMVVAACAAAWLPARRACMLDPAETLRHG